MSVQKNIESQHFSRIQSRKQVILLEDTPASFVSPLFPLVAGTRNDFERGRDHEAASRGRVFVVN